jgi:hypothetical protein
MFVILRFASRNRGPFRLDQRRIQIVGSRLSLFYQLYRLEQLDCVMGIFGRQWFLRFVAWRNINSPSLSLSQKSLFTTPSIGAVWVSSLISKITYLQPTNYKLFDLPLVGFDDSFT